jgi:histidinol-phosphate/aromatic aminotransferase/cobyric acid decarboxylase-like protein
MGNADAALLLRRHVELEDRYDDGDNGNFLSGWQCDNAWAAYIDQKVRDARSNIDGSKYQSLNSDIELASGLNLFHKTFDGVVADAYFCSEGGTALIFTLAAWLRQHGIAEVYYVPPLYFTFHFALKLLGIRARKVTEFQPYEINFKLRHPTTRGVLLLCDPVWYAGFPVPGEIMTELIDWQRKTGSIVIIDGSFQYLPWGNTTSEASSRLDPALTFRILCPTKCLAAHGYRFAYATIPRSYRAELVQLYARLFGSDSAESIAFSRVAMEELCVGAIPRSLMSICSERHATLRNQERIAAAWQPSSGYFIFEEILASISSEIPLMDGSYFEQRRFKKARRINLLSPSLRLLA